MKIETKKEYWKNGNIESDRSYLNEIPHGMMIRYCENGRMWRRYNQINGKKMAFGKNGGFHVNQDILSNKKKMI